MSQLFHKMYKAEVHYMSDINFKELTSMFRQPVVVLDEQGVVLFWSDEFEAFCGICKADAVGRKFRDLTDVDCELNDKLNIFPKNEMSYEFKGIVGGSTGVFTSVPLLCNNMQLNAILLNGDFKLISCHSEINFKHRMLPIEKLLSVVVHDLNNAIGGITGTLSLLDFKLSKGAALDPDSMKKYLSIMNESIGKVTSFMELLNELSTRDEQILIEGPLSALIDRVVTPFEDLDKEVITLDTSGCDCDVAVKVNSQRIETALKNILDNSVYAVKEKTDLDAIFKGCISISDRLISNEFGKVVAIEIKDNGTGILKDVADRVLDPFFTTKPKGAGKGIGLSLANFNILKSGGFLLIDSVDGEWTKVTVYLQVA